MLRNLTHNGVHKWFYREISFVKVLHNVQHDVEQKETPSKNSSLWHTTLPQKKKKAYSLKYKKNFNMQPKYGGTLLIKCKHEELNHYSGQRYNKFEIVPLASKGWHINKSKGDHFTVHLSCENPAFNASSDESQNKSFEELGLDADIVAALKQQNIVTPTNIQVQAIPRILNGKNTLITAETGCGKTLAYLLPILHKILQWKKNQSLGNVPLNSPLAYIVLPSRDLTNQVGEVTRDLCRTLGIHCKTLVGGHSKRLIRVADTEQVDILISSLGVISKLTTFKLYKTDMCKCFVLDEADSLLDDSFNEKSVNFIKRFPILNAGPPDPSVIPNGTTISLVSATMPRSLPEILNEAIPLESLKTISTNNLHRVQPHVPQTFMRVHKTERAAELLKVAKSCYDKKIPMMIFSNKSKTSDWISLFLNENGVECTSFHSKMTVEQREGKFEEFKNGRYNVMSCTDMASRGLDTIHVKKVLNFDFPMFIADYIHRCGRVGRVGSDSDCSVISFISGGRDAELLRHIELAVRTTGTLPNVNANITRILYHKMKKDEEQ